tara:strand:+ start:6598 stop:7146 length:549 start_codon:yes stop_codon:yes gene_type:complete
MKAANIRKTHTTTQVRNAWQGNIKKAKSAGFCSYVIEAIEDDRPDLRLCWCCGATGYQEIAHIIPHSLGGKCTPSNLFLLCNECHTCAPDFIESKPFIDYVNENAGRYSKAMSAVIENAISRVKDTWMENPEKAESIFLNMPNRLDGAFDQASRLGSQHGASVSLATRVAMYTHAIKASLKA